MGPESPNHGEDQEFSFDHLLDPNGDTGENETPAQIQARIEAAAVRTEAPDTSEIDAARDAALRYKVVLPPLSEGQIREISADRGASITQEEIDVINRARANGKDMSRSS